LLCEVHGVHSDHRVVACGTDKDIEPTKYTVCASNDGGDFCQLLRE
jgi:hypothetical protein